MQQVVLGRLLATPGALNAMERSGESPMTFIGRHVRKDWGEVCPDDARANEDALVRGDRLLSAYRTANGDKLWVITEADRSVTTILLPSEY